MTPRSLILLSKSQVSGFDEPLLQNGQIMWVHILKADADSLSRVSIDYDAVGFEKFSICVSLEKERSVFREGIGHLDVAAVET